LRDKINEIKGAPTIRSANPTGDVEESGDQQKIWRPKNQGRPNRRVAK